MTSINLTAETAQKCIGQTGRTFTIRYVEHIHELRNNKPDTGYSRHRTHIRTDIEHQGSKQGSEKRHITKHFEEILHIYKYPKTITTE